MSAELTWRGLRDAATERLAAAGSTSAEADARRIVAQASGLEAAELVMAIDDAATRRAGDAVERMVTRRCDGEPLQYVIGSWGFRTVDLHLDARVLIPRPETEVVVGAALDALQRRAGAGRADGLRAADLGTGSGAIALSLVAERSDVVVVATDVSPDALEVARANLAGLGTPARRVRLAQGSWFDALEGHEPSRFDLVVSNPPYVSESEELPDEVGRWEPRGALVAGPSGAEALEHLVARVGPWLLPGGFLVLEMAPHQADQVTAHALSCGLTEVSVQQDQYGRDRVLIARRAD